MPEDIRRRHRSSSRERDRHRRDKSDRSERSSYKSSKKSKKSRKSKKYSRRSTSSSSSSSSYESYSSSRRSKTRAPSSESNSRTSKTRPSSSENSRTAIIPKEIDLTDDHIQKALATIEENNFESKTFFSTRDREAPVKKLANEKVVIDLNSQTIQLPKLPENVDIPKDQIYHSNFIGDPELKTEKWIRKLYNFRQKHFED